MMQQLQQERAVIADIIQPILDQILDEVVPVLGSEVPPPVSCSETPETPDSPAYSPAYSPPEIESEDEALVSAEGGESVSYECTECQLTQENIYEIMMHLEVDHGLPDDEDILRSKVKEIKTREMPIQENNNEAM